jgi:hypothetical protein
VEWVVDSGECDGMMSVDGVVVDEVMLITVSMMRWWV